MGCNPIATPYYISTSPSSSTTTTTTTATKKTTAGKRCPSIEIQNLTYTNPEITIENKRLPLLRILYMSKKN